ncbi:MAG TPA: HNH endonuclease [Jeotgalicoccus sp.]|nr:HNH endonuclease [Jeotgalicoccus sp.]
MKVMKYCNSPNCRNLIEQYKNFCEEHKNKTSKSYEEWRNKHMPEYIKFYKSTAWQKKRVQALRRDEWICQDCAAEGIITVAQEVHHIVETKHDWSKRLELDNLISLCRTHHDRRHNR